MKIFCLMVTILYALVSAPQVLAASEFTTGFISTYTVAKSGLTNVEHIITLKNNLAHIYATQYSISTSGNQLTSISTSDESGSLRSAIDVQNGTTTIHLTIDHPSIGLAKTKTLTISYQTKDIVELIGDTTTINIPRLARANEAESYTRIVKVEGVGDRAQLLYPTPNQVATDDLYTTYTFTGHQGDSLSLLFGNSVTYKLNLTYELRNKELGPVDSELALPPDTSYQHVILSSISPAPLDIHLDHDGNWLARYNLKSQEKLLVKAELYATVYPTPVLPDPSTTLLEKTPRSKYWDISSSSVTTLATRLKTPENIYRYLTDNFTYNYGGIKSGTERLGAVKAIAEPSSVLCTEFTDSFISLARVLGIPAREINGYGYTKNTLLQPQNQETDILHAWPEYYADKHWLAVDPTWGNTTGGVDYFHKLDFSHITFVRHGVEDSYPLPAGAYKSQFGEKYVSVEIATVVPPEIKATETRGKLLVNTGNVAIIDQTYGYIPPYGSYELKASPTNSLWQKLRSLLVQLATWAHIR